MLPELKNSIRARMTLSFTAVIAGIMLLACGGMVGYAYATAERNADTLLHNAARKIQSELSNGEQPPEMKELMEEERDLANENLVLLIVDKQGKILRQSQKYVPILPLQSQDNWRTVTVPYRENLAVIGLNWERTGQILRTQAFGFLGIGIVVTAVSACGAWILVGHTLSPIDQLARQAKTASAENLRVALTAPSHDAEMVGLVGTLNDLLGRLAQTASAKGRFYASASHELRTPLQALYGHLELSLSRERTSAERHATIQEAHAQTQRLSILVRDLLTLNRLEFAEQSPLKEPICVSELCCQILHQFTPLMESKHLRVTAQLTDLAEISAPRSHLEMLCRNLIENAVKYATPGGEVGVQYMENSLIIRNDFPAAVVLDTTALFEPFYRPDVSRAAETGGNGLGLAICRTITETNGWHIELYQTSSGIECHINFGGKSGT